MRRRTYHAIIVVQQHVERFQVHVQHVPAVQLHQALGNLAGIAQCFMHWQSACRNDGASYAQCKDLPLL